MIRVVEHLARLTACLVLAACAVRCVAAGYPQPGILLLALSVVVVLPWRGI